MSRELNASMPPVARLAIRGWARNLAKRVELSFPGLKTRPLGGGKATDEAMLFKLKKPPRPARMHPAVPQPV